MPDHGELPPVKPQRPWLGTLADHRHSHIPCPVPSLLPEPSPSRQLPPVASSPSCLIFPRDPCGHHHTAAACDHYVAELPIRSPHNWRNRLRKLHTAPGHATCGAAMSVCQIAVEFSPLAAGPLTGSLIVKDTLTGLTASIALSGTGTVIPSPPPSPPSTSSCLSAYLQPNLQQRTRSEASSPRTILHCDHCIKWRPAHRRILLCSGPFKLDCRWLLHRLQAICSIRSYLRSQPGHRCCQRNPRSSPI